MPPFPKLNTGNGDHRPFPGLLGHRGSHVAKWVHDPRATERVRDSFQSSTRLYPHYVSYLDVQEQTPQFTILDLRTLVIDHSPTRLKVPSRYDAGG